jgi:pyruvate dehydrogenase E1 component alpha subunit
VTAPTLSPGAANLWVGDDQAGAVNRPGHPGLTQNQQLSAYRLMLLIRRFEEKAGQLYGMGYIGGFCHLYIGQEAVVAGMEMAISDGDQVITAYRDHGHMLAAGMEPKRVMAELTGRCHGYAKGKGGSMHMFSRHRRRSGAARHRACVRQQISRQRSRLPDLFRRRGRQSGPGL